MASRDECIICFNETYDSGDRVTINMEVDEIVSIVKTCKCKFKVHETCFLKWIKKKPFALTVENTIKVIQSNF